MDAPSESPPTATVDRALWLTGLSYLPFLADAIRYLLLGSYVPFAVAVIIGGPLIYGLSRGGAWRRRLMRGWSVLMILWGASRLSLLALIYPAGLDEGHLRAQLNPVFLLLSLAYIVAGVMLWRSNGDRMP